MPVSGNYGTPGNPNGDIYSSYWEIQWYSGSDPAHVEGDFWGRSDLTSGDKIATLRFDNGSAVVDIPLFPETTNPNSSSIKKKSNIQTPNGEAWMPILETNGYTPSYNYLGYQHGGVRHGVHDSLSAIPDSAVAQYDATQASFSDGASVGTNTDFINANDLGTGNATYQTAVQNGNAVYRYDGVDDGHHSGAGAFSLSGSLTYIAVVVSAAQGGSDEAIMARADSNDADTPNIRWDAGNSAWAFAGAVSLFGNATAPPAILTGIADGANSKLRENGTDTASGDVGAAGMNSLNLGAINGNSTWFLNGDIGEALVYDANLEATGDLSSEEQRLADKWGITL